MKRAINFLRWKALFVLRRAQRQSRIDGKSAADLVRGAPRGGREPPAWRRLQERVRLHVQGHGVAGGDALIEQPTPRGRPAQRRAAAGRDDRAQGLVLNDRAVNATRGFEAVVQLRVLVHPAVELEPAVRVLQPQRAESEVGPAELGADRAQVGRGPAAELERRRERVLTCVVARHGAIDQRWKLPLEAN